MYLIIILISLAVERFISHHVEYRRFQWFLALGHWLRNLGPVILKDGPIGVIITVLPLVALTFLCVALFGALFYFVFSIIVLLFCFGPKDIDADTDSYIQACERDDSEEKQAILQDMLNGRTYTGFEGHQPRMVDALFVEANDRIFSVLFWFLILGPAGALLYRFSSELHRDAVLNDETPAYFREVAAYLHAILDWPSGHLTALGYAISGSFTHAFEQWTAQVRSRRKNGNLAQILIATGRGAALLDTNKVIVEMDEVDKVSIANELVWRTIIVWVVAVALFTIAGWVS